MSESQNYKNHTRWRPPYHFFLVPLMLINLIYTAVRVFQDPSWDRGMFLLLAFGLVTLTVLSRTQTLTVQDRLIQLEERVRYKAILSSELARRALSLKMSQVIGLRFAGDEELPDLIERALNGEFEKQKDIKTAVINWRGDFLRV